MTQIRSGVPTLAEVERLLGEPLYADLCGANDAFLDRHARALARYGRKWGASPMQGWSRRWEYPYVAQRVLEFLRGQQGGAKVLDAGSGITFFPYYLCQQAPGTEITCCDLARSYAPVYDKINAATDARVRFVQAMLQQLPLDADSVDAIYCISVLEHTGNYGAILDEFARVLRPGGLLVITFDISLDGRTDIAPAGARALLEEAGRRFDLPAGLGVAAEFERLQRPGDLLTTDHIRRTAPHLLPWPHPVLKSAWDLLHGRGWTGGFFSLACCGVTLHARGRKGA